MPSQTHGVTTSRVTWTIEETDVDQSSLDFITISCAGWVKYNGCTIDDALLLVPDVIEISPDGPVENAAKFEGATLDTRNATFGGNGLIDVTATYKIPVSYVIDGPGGEGGDKSESDSDRYDTRVELENVPILTHPVAMLFQRVDKLGLKNLLEGDVWPNKSDKWDEGTEPDKEFQTFNENQEQEDYIFSETEYEVDGIVASPKDFARMIAAGIEQYQRPAVRFMWYAARTNGPDPAELNRVGDVTTPPRAPTVSNRQWIYAGCADSEQAIDAHTTTREYILSERGGVLKQLYKGGTGDINTETTP